MTKELKTLHAVLKETFPQFCDETGELHYGLIGKELGRSRQAMYACIWRNNSLSADNARHLIGISNGKLTAETILPYIS